MKLPISFVNIHKTKLIVVSLVLAVISCFLTANVYANDGDTAKDGRLITFHDRGVEKVILTHAQTVQDALKDADIATTQDDTIEPKPATKLVATDYVVNIYRARPVIVVDGMIRQKVMTAAQTPSSIVDAAKVNELKDEDTTSTAANSDVVADGASTVLTIHRATPLTLSLYGKPTAAYTHAKTVRDMLNEKKITLSSVDHLSVNEGTPIVAGMTVSIWRDGVQTVTVDEPISYTSRQVLDVDQPVGYRSVQTAGINGRKSVTYEISAQNGRETGRKVIQSVTLEQPKEEVIVVGAKGANPLTESKGSQQYTDSKGVTHRETYYDLPMNSVMAACGGGTYTIRADGAKVDKDGYILIAANLGNYPRCSIVETSMGPGKVYDTGGFAVRYPNGFDLATDWSNSNGN